MAKYYVDKEVLFQALAEKFKARIGSSHLPTWNDAYDTAKSISSVDVEEVVRCKDCHMSFRDPHGERYCNNLVSRCNPAESLRYVNDYDYCSWGVREEIS